MSKRSEMIRKIAEQELAEAWPQWRIVGILGNGTYGDVYKICKEELGFSSYSALKIIRSDETFKDTAVVNGAELSDPFQLFLKDVADEIHIMEILKGAPNIVIIDDYKVLRDGGECSVLIRMELLDNLASYIKKRGELSLGNILKIGIDICRALEYCEHSNIIHRDIKESNIFYNQDLNTFKLGDFGVSRRMDNFGQKASMTGIGTISYMAPEVFSGESYDSTVDIYSLGIVLYTLLNQNRLPFTPMDKPDLDAADVQKANNHRLNREELPPPVHADPALARIICKACSPRTQDRYQSARAFRQSLIEYTNKLDRKLLRYPPQAAAAILAESMENEADPVTRSASDSPVSNEAIDAEESIKKVVDRISDQISRINMPVRILSAAVIVAVVVFLIIKNTDKGPVAGGSFDYPSADSSSSPPQSVSSLTGTSMASITDSSTAGNSKPGPEPQEYISGGAGAVPETTAEATKEDTEEATKEDTEEDTKEDIKEDTNKDTKEDTKEDTNKDIKEETNPYADQLESKDYVCYMELADGSNIGKYVVVKNNSQDILDLHADFQFLDKKGKTVAKDSYEDYAVAPGQKGVLLQQSNLPEVDSIKYSLTASKSDYLPISECIKWKVEDLKEDGIIVHVNNESYRDIHDFRVRVLWFNEKKQLETVAFRWSNNTDHVLRSGETCDLDFQSPWGKETYSVFFHGIAVD